MHVRAVLWWVLWSVWVVYGALMSLLALVLVAEGLLIWWRRWTRPAGTRTVGVVADDDPPADDVFLTATGGTVTVKRMPPGHDSLFQAVAHQLMYGRASLQQADPRQVRSLAVQHVLDHLPEYRTAVLRSVADLGERYAVARTQDDVVLRYLADAREAGFPPGWEAIQAIADAFRVDVDLFPEGGFEETVATTRVPAKASIGVALRTWQDEHGAPAPHYDSVLSWLNPDTWQVSWYVAETPSDLDLQLHVDEKHFASPQQA